jgi:hypothetical protein
MSAPSPKQQRPFRARAGAREQIEDLARCEPVCRPFLEYGVETTNDEAIFTVTNPSTGMARAHADVTLDAFDVLPTTRALATRACWSGTPTAAFTSARRARPVGAACLRVIAEPLPSRWLAAGIGSDSQDAADRAILPGQVCATR